MTLALTAPSDAAICRETIARHSRSFALASVLLGPTARDHAAAVYAWCREVDDAIDLAPAGHAAAALAEQRAALAGLYAGAPRSVAARAFAAVVQARAVPLAYPAALLDGMQMDVDGHRYHGVDDLITYSYRVASVVGLIMCHVLGVRDDRALVPAAHLGIAMQLTNIARDVGEDWERGRLYLPTEVLARHGLAPLGDRLGLALPTSAWPGLHQAQLDVLVLADRYYRSAAIGYRALPVRAGAAIRTAARVYRAIGGRIRRLGPAAVTTRAVVGRGAKLGWVASAVAAGLTTTPARWIDHLRGRRPRVPTTTLELADVPRL